VYRNGITGGGGGAEEGRRRTADVRARSWRDEQVKMNSRPITTAAVPTCSLILLTRALGLVQAKAGGNSSRSASSPAIRLDSWLPPSGRRAHLLCPPS
jgi:hypothetical protein